MPSNKEKMKKGLRSKSEMPDGYLYLICCFSQTRTNFCHHGILLGLETHEVCRCPMTSALRLPKFMHLVSSTLTPILIEQGHNIVFWSLIPCYQLFKCFGIKNRREAIPLSPAGYIPPKVIIPVTIPNCRGHCFDEAL